MDADFFERLVFSQVTGVVGYLKVVKGEPMDTFPLKLIDLATGETKRFLNAKSKKQLKALRIAVRDFNKRKETEPC